MRHHNARGVARRPSTTPPSPSGWTPSRRCSSSPRRGTTRRGRTGRRRRPSARRRRRSPSSSAPDASASCAGSGPASSAGSRSSSRRATSPSCGSSSARSPPSSSGSAASSGSRRSAPSRSGARSAFGRRTSCGRPRWRDGSRRCRASGPRRSSASSKSWSGPRWPGRSRGAGFSSTARGSCSSRMAEALGGEVAGDPRRWRETSDRLSIVSSDNNALDRFETLPEIVAVVERGEHRALGVTGDGVPVELVVAEPGRFGTELVRATGSEEYVAALEPLAGRCERGGGLRAAGRALVPARAPRGAVPRRASAPGRARRRARRPPLPHDVVGRQGFRCSRWPRAPSRAATST